MYAENLIQAVLQLEQSIGVNVYKGKAAEESRCVSQGAKLVQQREQWAAGLQGFLD